MALEQQEMRREERKPWLRAESFKTGTILGNSVQLVVEEDDEEVEDNDGLCAKAEDEEEAAAARDLEIAMAGRRKP